MNGSRSFTHSDIAGGRQLGFPHLIGFTHVLLGFPNPLGSRRVMGCFTASRYDIVICAAVVNVRLQLLFLIGEGPVSVILIRICFVCFLVFLFVLDNEAELVFFFLSVTHRAFQSSDEKYVKNVYQWMIPFLHRCEHQSPGLANSLFKEYLVTLAKEDLTLPLKIFQNSKPAVSIEPG